MVRDGRFLEDLYYLLNVITIHVPPLRERRADIPLLVDHFLRRYAREHHREVYEASEEAMMNLMGRDWPGNVRELRNVVERAVLLGAGSVVSVGDIPCALKSAAPLTAPGRLFSLPEKRNDIDELEQDCVTQALERNGGNQARAGQLLGLTRHQVMYRMKMYGLSAPRIPKMSLSGKGVAAYEIGPR